MKTLKLFFIALKVYLIFAAASFVTAIIVTTSLSIFGGLLAMMTNPVSLVTVCIIGWLLVKTGIWANIVSWNIPGKIGSFYKFVGSELKPVLDVKF